MRTLLKMLAGGLIAAAGAPVLGVMILLHAVGETVVAIGGLEDLGG